MASRDTNLIAVASGTITRPSNTTQYASGDLVANSETAGSVASITLAGATINPGGRGKVERVRLAFNDATLTNAQFRVHLFTTAPTTFTNGDNGAIAMNGFADYLGSVDITVGQAFSASPAGAVGFADCDISFVAKAGGSDLYGVLEARAAYTPTSGEIFTLSAEIARYA